MAPPFQSGQRLDQPPTTLEVLPPASKGVSEGAGLHGSSVKSATDAVAEGNSTRNVNQFAASKLLGDPQLEERGSAPGGKGVGNGDGIASIVSNKADVSTVHGAGNGDGPAAKLAGKGDALTGQGTGNGDGPASIVAGKGDASTVQGAPKADMPMQGTPKGEVSVQGALKTEAPVSGTPKGEVTVQGTPKTEAPVQGAPKVEAPVSGTPKAEAPVSGTPKAEAPVSGTPKAEAPVSGTPKAEAPVSGTPKAEAPVSGVPKAEAPVSGVPKAEAPVQGTPKAEAPVQGAPKAEAPVQGAPRAEVPVQGAPKGEVSVQGAPKAEVPVQGAPKAEVPVQGAPKAEAPVQGAPKVEVPVQGALKTEVSVQGVQKVEALMQGLLKSEAPVQGMQKVEGLVQGLSRIEALVLGLPKLEAPSVQGAPKAEGLLAPGLPKVEALVEGLSLQKVQGLQQQKDVAPPGQKVDTRPGFGQAVQRGVSAPIDLANGHDPKARTAWRTSDKLPVDKRKFRQQLGQSAPLESPSKDVGFVTSLPTGQPGMLVQAGSERSPAPKDTTTFPISQPAFVVQSVPVRDVSARDTTTRDQSIPHYQQQKEIISAAQISAQGTPVSQMSQSSGQGAVIAGGQSQGQDPQGQGGAGQNIPNYIPPSQVLPGLQVTGKHGASGQTPAATPAAGGILPGPVIPASPAQEQSVTNTSAQESAVLFDQNSQNAAGDPCSVVSSGTVPGALATQPDVELGQEESVPTEYSIPPQSSSELITASSNPLVTVPFDASVDPLSLSENDLQVSERVSSETRPESSDMTDEDMERIRREVQNKEDQDREELKREEEEERIRREREEEQKRISDTALALLAARKAQEEALREQARRELQKDKRRKYVIKERDTLESIAARMLHDPRLALLIFEINNAVIPHEDHHSKIVVQLTPSQLIYLPTADEIKKFRARPSNTRQMQFEYDANLLNRIGACDAQTSCEITVRQCPECKHLLTLNAPICSACGHSFVSANVDEQNPLPESKAASELQPTEIFDWVPTVIEPVAQTDRVMSSNVMGEASEQKHRRAVQQFIEQLGESTRIVKTRMQQSDEFSVRLEIRRETVWTPILVYEIGWARSVRQEYRLDGKARSILIDLPMAAIYELVENDLSSNWRSYYQSYMMGRSFID